jgi:hypothetical protein
MVVAPLAGAMPLREPCPGHLQARYTMRYRTCGCHALAGTLSGGQVTMRECALSFIHQQSPPRGLYL